MQETCTQTGSFDSANAALYAIPNFTGVDLSFEMVSRCRAAFADKENWQFLTLDEFSRIDSRFDLTMSLDVIYHLIEDDVFDRYMNMLFSRARRNVLIYSSNHDEQAPARHVTHREYGRWIAKHRPTWRLRETMEHPFPRGAKSNPRHTALSFFQLYECVS